MRRILILALLVVTAAPAAARRPDFTAELKAAAADPLALERLLPSLTPGRMARALASSDPAVVRAAIQLTPSLPFRLLLIPELVTLGGRPEPALAALEALAQIARELGRVSGLRDQLGEDEHDAFAVGVMAIAQRSDAAPTVRVAALDVAEALLGGGESGDPATLSNLTTALLGDKDPLVRGAAVDLLPAVDAKLAARLTGFITDDPDDGVAIAAAARVCVATPAPTLPDATAARVRALVVLPVTGASDILAILPCIRAHGQADDAALLKALKKSSSPEVKKAAAALAFKSK